MLYDFATDIDNTQRAEIEIMSMLKEKMTQLEFHRLCDRGGLTFTLRPFPRRRAGRRTCVVSNNSSVFSNPRSAPTTRARGTQGRSAPTRKQYPAQADLAEPSGCPPATRLRRPPEPTGNRCQAPPVQYGSTT
jgi:hypothetical protein